jgi:1-acyl-sn-glycerol-3-phosphate acyltransferase
VTPTPRPLQVIRCLKLIALLIWISTALLLAFPVVGDQRRLRFKQRWSRRILQVLAIRVDACGEMPDDDSARQRNTGEFFPAGSLIVANHISWLDILAINAVQAVAFVSKAEVRQWPLVGWIAEKADTVFLRRGSRGHARIVNAEIDALLNAGKIVAIFPEGTTTDGTHLLGFHAALLQPAVETGHPIQPLVLSYHHADGSRSLAPVYVGETTLLESFMAILACRSMSVRIYATAALSPENRSRRELANAAHAAIAARLDNYASCHPVSSSGQPVP